MQIHGFQKTTLLDFPGKVACTIFTGGCNFRCPFCHNGDLVLSPASVPVIPEDEIFAHLKKRAGILEGICVTGGEPTLQKDLPDFLKRLKELGLSIKLDTNGYEPEILAALIDQQLVDFVAMDIKHCLEKYNFICQRSDFDIGRIEASVSLLKNGSLPYEFRTTIVKELHDIEDFSSIGIWLAGRASYYLQSYKETDQVIHPGFSAYSYDKLVEIQNILLPTIPNTQIRGIN